MGNETRPLAAGGSRRRMSMLPVLLAIGIAAGCLFGIVLRICAAPRSSDTTQAPVAEKTEAKPPPDKRVFDSPLAGLGWYDGNAQTLAAQLDGFLGKADAPAMKDIAALLMPHAGYRYSGQTAAYAVKALEGNRYGRVVVMGPSHRIAMRDVASVPKDYSHYATPFGEVPLDLDFIAALRTHPEFQGPPEADAREHSVQIELPLLQKALANFKFVPIVVGQIGLESARRMGAILRASIDANTLVVASSDFTHYGDNYDFVPFRENISENLKTLDMGAWDFIEKRDAKGFDDYINRTGATVCGHCPIMVLLSMLPENAQAHLLHYDTSGNVMGDYSNSVSYVAAAFTGQWPKGERAVMQPQTATLTADEKHALLKLARGTLTYYLEHGKPPTPETLGITIAPGMQTVMGAFVTLKKHGQLRGCIGEIFPRRALYEVVMEQAVNAGVNDYRFSQVTAPELAEIDFEISALTPPHDVASYQDIVIGKHGMVIEKNGRRAVFLPQVAPEQGWDLAETLTHLSTKAGLAADAWREGASYMVFEAIVFGEKE